MAKKALLSPRVIRQLISYDADSGTFAWLPRVGTGGYWTPRRAATWNRMYAGKGAFTSQDANGYSVTKIYDNKYYGHRVAYAIMTGQWPIEMIDHINAIKNDNRWCNIRAVSRIENQRNLRMRSTNKSGITGVHWDKKSKKWAASLRIDGKQTALGRFAEIEDAAAAYRKALHDSGFHRNHGAAPPSSE